MKTAVTIRDADGLTKNDIFDPYPLYRKYMGTVPRDEGRAGHFHPSSVGGCGRRNVYEYNRVKPLPHNDPGSQELFDLGHAVHDLVQGRLADLYRVLPEDMNYKFRAEVPYDESTDQLYVDYGIGGTTDGILEIWTDEWRQRGILEVKTINDNGYTGLTGPKDDHVEQAHLYAYRFDCPIIWIWYYNKNDSMQRVYPVIFDMKILKGALAKFESWLRHAEAGTLPDREESWYMCPRCEYRDTCQPEIVQIQNAMQRKKDQGKRVAEMRKRGL